MVGVSLTSALDGSRGASCSMMRLRMRGKGAPSLIDPEVRGDQYVELKVVVPRVADERSKEILRELAKLNPDDPRKDLR